jgi:hypothetical protein
LTGAFRTLTGATGVWSVGVAVGRAGLEAIVGTGAGAVVVEGRIVAGRLAVAVTVGLATEAPATGSGVCLSALVEASAVKPAAVTKTATAKNTSPSRFLMGARSC